MKKSSLFVLTAVLLLAIFGLPAAKVQAGEDVTCVSDPSEGHTGTVFVITCYGFDPNVTVFAYTVEPDGFALAYGGIKTDKSGVAVLGFPSRFGPGATAASGTWTAVLEQLGPGGGPQNVVHRGVARFTITGGTEGVSGASLSGSLEVARKGRDTLILTGSGFLPGEVVSVWVDFPRSECSSFTEHFGFSGSGVSATLNFPFLIGLGSVALGSVRADSSGSFELAVTADPFLCEGTYHFVARGNESHRGGDTYSTLVGNPVTETVALVASPSVASSMFGRVAFFGSGFAPDEPVNCWLTSPEGQAITVPGTRADGAGNVSLELITGSIFFRVTGLGINLELSENISSEGALGEWAMTCRGANSHDLGIARFTLTGGAVDP